MLPHLTIQKEYIDIPFAHRQPNHHGHCRFLHGHNWAFAFTFAARELDKCGFIIDFGGPEMKELKEWLNVTFDHRLLLNSDDPQLEYLSAHLVHLRGSNEYAGVSLADILVVPDCSCEGLAKWLHHQVGEHIFHQTKGRVSVVSVTVREDSKNSATSST